METGQRRRSSPSVAWLLLFAISAGFWLVLSGRIEPLYLGAGALSAALVATLTCGIERRAHFMGRTGEGGPLFRPGLAWVRFPVYLAWLGWQMVRSALGVAAVLAHPRLPITPTVIRVPTRFTGELELTTLGNSITLTPGTVTIDVVDGALVIHALTAAGAADLDGGAMEARVGWTFGGPGR
jgi:multicomponent Na+:H+ antiporter subunit E